MADCIMIQSNTTPDKENCEKLEKASKDFLQNIKEPLKISIHSNTTAIKPIDRKSHGAKLLNFHEGKTYFGIGLEDDLTANSTVEDLNKNLTYFALDKVSVPGIDIPLNWEVSPRTPISSFKDGVKITHFDGKRMKIHVETKCFAIGGSQNDILIPACASAPAGSYFQVRQDFKIDVDIDVPVEL